MSLSVTIRYIEGCPQRRVAHDHLRAAAREVGIDLDVQLEPVVTHQDAQRLGFAGSPTVLLEGADPFAQPGAIPALACRLYATPAGPAGAPTLEQLVAALRERRAAGQVRAASRHGGGERLDAPRPPRDGRQPH